MSCGTNSMLHVTMATSSETSRSCDQIWGMRMCRSRTGRPARTRAYEATMEDSGASTRTGRHGLNSSELLSQA